MQLRATIKLRVKIQLVGNIQCFVLKTFRDRAKPPTEQPIVCESVISGDN